MGRIYVIGGTDSWICLNSVEIYDPELKKWQFGPQLNVARRGAGCDVFNGKHIIFFIAFLWIWEFKSSYFAYMYIYNVHLDKQRKIQKISVYVHVQVDVEFFY